METELEWTKNTECLFVLLFFIINGFLFCLQTKLVKESSGKSPKLTITHYFKVIPSHCLFCETGSPNLGLKFQFTAIIEKNKQWSKQRFDIRGHINLQSVRKVVINFLAISRSFNGLIVWTLFSLLIMLIWYFSSTYNQCAAETRLLHQDQTTSLQNWS